MQITHQERIRMFTVKIVHTIDRDRQDRLIEKIKIRKEKERKKERENADS